MKILYLILEDYNYTGLKEFLVDVRLAGIEVVPYAVVDGKMDEISDIPGSYMITDCIQGVRLAREAGMGYVFYERDAAFYDTGLRTENGECISDSLNDAECIIQGFEETDADFIIKMYQRHHGLPWTILTTDRLRLREMTVSDVDRLYEIYSEPSITMYTEPLYEDRDEEIEYTRAYIRNQYEFFGFGLWIVEEKLNPNNINRYRIIGRAGITRREGYDEAELGYIIEKDRQNRGYAAEACRAIIRYAKEKLDMSGLNCFVQPGNAASIRLCDRLGFEYMEEVCINGILFGRYHLDCSSLSTGECI